MCDICEILEQIRFARRYTLRLVEDIGQTEWFRMPTPGISHVAWQVGHLTMAQYRLTMLCIRGSRPEDDALIPKPYLTLFARTSTPDPDPARYPAPAEIRGVFDRVNDEVHRQLQGLNDLDGPLVVAHSLAKTKREVLLWCAHHEMLHAGQIGFLRRLLGYAPQW